MRAFPAFCVVAVLAACQANPPPGSAQERFGRSLVTGGELVRQTGESTGDVILWMIGSGIASIGTLLTGQQVHKKLKAKKAKKAAALKT